MEAAAADAGISQDDWRKFVAYVGCFYANMGNYHSFGNCKFVPDLAPETLKTILISNPLYEDADAFYKEVIDELYP